MLFTCATLIGYILLQTAALIVLPRWWKVAAVPTMWCAFLVVESVVIYKTLNARTTAGYLIIGCLYLTSVLSVQIAVNCVRSPENQTGRRRRFLDWLAGFGITYVGYMALVINNPGQYRGGYDPYSLGPLNDPTANIIIVSRLFGLVTLLTYVRRWLRFAPAFVGGVWIAVLVVSLMEWMN